MPGLPELPYRLPCGRASWPASGSALALCTSHKLAREMAIPERCNIGWTGSPTYLPPTCSNWHDGNCYSADACHSGTATGILTTAAIYPVGAKEIYLSAGSGSILNGDFVTFSGDLNTYRIETGATAADLNGYTIYLAGYGLEKATAATPTAITILPRGQRDISACNKWGWFAVRGYEPWDGRNGFASSCKSSAALTTCLNAAKSAWQSAINGIQSTFNSCVSGLDPGSGAYCLCALARDSAVGSADADYYNAIGNCLNAATVCDSDTDHYLTIARSASFTFVDTDPLFPSQGGTSVNCGFTVDTSTGLVRQDACIDAPITDPTLANFLMGNWGCGPVLGSNSSFDSFLNLGFFIAKYNGGSLTRSGSALSSVTGLCETATWTFTILEESNTKVRLQYDESFGTYSSTYLATWELSNPLTLAQCVANAWSHADRWDMSDRTQWRKRNYGPWNLGHGGNSHLPVPLIRRRRVYGGVSPDISTNGCGALPACAGFTPNCPYDGAIMGLPMPIGTGPHYAFADTFGLLSLQDLGWNPGLENPDNATWWTGFDDPSGFISLSDYTQFPPGGFIRAFSTEVFVQKWAETAPVTNSANFARPCGADRADYPSAWPICGRCAISGQVADGATVTVTLADAAPHLLAGDSVDLVSYGPAPDFTATVLATVTVLAVVDDSHFTFTGTVNAATHAKSTGSPHYRWHDDRPKGDFIFCTSETNLCTAAETLTCEDDCLPANPCSPAVMAVLGPDSPERFTNATVLRLPASPAYHAGVRYVIHPRAYEPDPLYVGAGTAPSIESRCAPPDGAAFPSGISYAGCGEWV